MAFHDPVDYDFAYTAVWIDNVTSTLPSKSPLLPEDGRVLHPNVIYKTATETSPVRKAKLLKAYAEVVTHQALILRGILDAVPGWSEQIVVASSPLVTYQPVIKNPPFVSIEFDDYVSKVVSACSKPETLTPSLLERIVCHQITYATCPGCKRKAATYMTTPPAMLSIPRFYFALSSAKKIEFLGSLTVEGTKPMFLPVYESVLGLCSACRVKCGKCSRRVGPHSPPRYAHMLSVDGVCHLCNAAHLSNAVAPTLDRTMLATLSNKKIILD